MSQALKNKSAYGLIWSGIERVALSGSRFIMQIILARLLLPKDYGVVGIIVVLLSISQIFIDGGLAGALVQDKNRTEKDFSTAFIANSVMSIFCYFILFFAAPYIASFYEIEELTTLIRVLSIVLIIAPISVIQKVRLQINLDFKTLFKSSFVSIVISATIGILLAYKGFGVWALVIQVIFDTALNAMFLFFYVRWIPRAMFSMKSFRYMFGFGYKLMLSDLLHAVYGNITALLVGKLFSVRTLGLFSKAESFASFPSTTLSGIIMRVVYPVFSSVEDDLALLRSVFLKYLKFSAGVIVPFFTLIIALASPLILFLMGEKWSEIVPMLQILSIAWMLDFITQINLRILYAKRRSGLALKLEFIKKPMAILILVTSAQFGIMAVCYGKLLYSVFALLINSHFSGKLISVSIKDQLMSVLPVYAISLLVGCITFSITFLFSCLLAKLFLSAFIGFMIYVGMAYIFKLDIFVEIYSFLTQRGRS